MTCPQHGVSIVTIDYCNVTSSIRIDSNIITISTSKAPDVQAKYYKIRAKRNGQVLYSHQMTWRCVLTIRVYSRRVNCRVRVVRPINQLLPRH